MQNFIRFWPMFTFHFGNSLWQFSGELSNFIIIFTKRFLGPQRMTVYKSRNSTGNFFKYIFWVSIED